MWSEYPEIYEELAVVESYIKKNITSRNKLLSKIVTSLVEAGGKRLRPAFVIIASKFGKYDREKVISLAGAIEILHTATLVHDDVIDRAKIRRGKRTVADKYGTDMAVYAGDYLLTKAVLMLSKGMPVENLDKVARAVKTICEGEVDQYQDRFNIELSVFSYLKRISKKTAILFSAACGLGAYISECPDQMVKTLARFGFNYGMAFQIRDDLNDYLSSAKESGKPVLKDLLEGTITLPVIFAMSRKESIRGTLKSLFGKYTKLSRADAGILFDMIKESGGIEDSMNMLQKYILRCYKLLEKLPDNNFRDILKRIVAELETSRLKNIMADQSKKHGLSLKHLH